MLTLVTWALYAVELATDIPGSWTPSANLKPLMCLLNPMMTIKQLWRLIITYDNNGLPVHFYNGWDLVRQNFVLNQGIIILVINAIATNIIALIFEFVFSDSEERDSKCCFGFRQKNKVKYIGGDSQSDATSGICVQKLAKKAGGESILDCKDIIFEENTITAICGPNGSGKTTFIKELSNALEKVTEPGQRHCIRRSFYM